ncbi:type II secretion system F family protein [Anaeromyxobacter paludicola]|uniref:Type II secretion system protein GspF domain-containing protein n=1 Tax=Anaeromyxobacter paludicola TaxID=2918171 RepID=A0ABN6N8U9_9BACT|nr:type II secretion system F family protein [Anaeromyxobacter paludicola]BDG08489.1 hypothetical protein AMPC_16020 [Anaeromyxobacter paludicola]
MQQLFILLLALALVAVVEAARQAWRYWDDRRSGALRRRLQTLGEGLPGESALLREARFASNPGLDQMLRHTTWAPRLAQLLEQTYSRVTVAQLLGYAALSGLAALVAGVALRLGPFLTILSCAGGVCLPFLFLDIARDRRSRKISEQLPEALEMMARSLRAGHAISGSFRIVATEMPEPVSVEFGRAFEEQKLGLSLEQAVLQMAGRAPGNGDLKIFAISTIIQKETGGNLAEILSNIAETIRARYRFQGKLRALTAEGRASALVLGLLPLLMALLLQLINPGYLKPLVADPLGQRILGTACLLWAAGFLWMKQMIRIDV